MMNKQKNNKRKIANTQYWFLSGKNMLKGPSLSDLPCKEGHHWFTVVPFNPIYPDVWFHDWFPGGVKLPPSPSIFWLWYKSITFDTFLGSTLIICNKKMANFQKSKYLLRNLVFIKKCAKKKIVKLQQIIHFWKGLYPANLNVKKTFSKFSKLKCVFKKNRKCANFLWRRLCKHLCKISLQKLCNLHAFVKGFQKSYKMLKSNDWK